MKYRCNKIEYLIDKEPEKFEKFLRGESSETASHVRECPSCSKFMKAFLEVDYICMTMPKIKVDADRALTSEFIAARVRCIICEHFDACPTDKKRFKRSIIEIVKSTLMSLPLRYSITLALAIFFFVAAYCSVFLANHAGSGSNGFTAGHYEKKSAVGSFAVRNGSISLPVEVIKGRIKIVRENGVTVEYSDNGGERNIINEGDILHTLPGSRCLIEKGGASFTVFENTTAYFAAGRTFCKNGEIRFKFIKGSISDSKGYLIETSHCGVIVFGTTLNVKATSAATFVSVTEGRVGVKVINENLPVSFYLRENHTLEVGRKYAKLTDGKGITACYVEKNIDCVTKKEDPDVKKVFEKNKDKKDTGVHNIEAQPDIKEETKIDAKKIMEPGADGPEAEKDSRETVNRSTVEFVNEKEWLDIIKEFDPGFYVQLIKMKTGERRKIFLKNIDAYRNIQNKINKKQKNARQN